MKRLNSFKTPVPIFKILSILLFFFFGICLFSQEKISIDGQEFDKTFGPPDEKEDFPKGTYTLHPADFIFTAGQMYEGSPPKSVGKFKWEDKEISNLGEFNNETVELILSRKPNSLKTAQTRLEAAVEFDPLFFPVRYNYARVLELQWLFPEAKFQFEKAILLAPKYYRNHYHIGIILHRMGKFPEAADALRRAVPLQKFRTDAKSLLCILAHTKGYPRVYRKFIIESYPELPTANASICKAAAYYYQEKFHKSYSILKKVKLPEKEEGLSTYNLLYHFFLADSAERVQDLETAIHEYEKLLTHPFDPVFLHFSEKTIQRKLETAKYIWGNRKKQ